MQLLSGFSSFSSFFNQVASKYVSRYNQLAQNTSITPELIETEPESTAFPVEDDKVSLGEIPATETPGATVEDLADSFEPGEIEKDPSVIAPVDNGEADENDGSQGETAVTPNGASAATYENKFSHLRYKLNLEFNMESFERTLHRLSTISDGESTEISESFEQLLGANFGLKTDLALFGHSATQSAVANVDGAASYKNGSGKFLARGLQKQALGLKSALPSASRGAYQLAVNRFALRYKSDTNFSLAHFNRFQSQVSALNGSAALDGYNGAAGELAGTASNDLMSAFFDTVQSHLGESEAALIEKVQQFFDIAASELGMSEASLDAAEAQLTGSIESFFDRVGQAVSSQAARYSIETTAVEPEVILGPFEPQSPPPAEQLDADTPYLDALAQTLENNETALAEQLAEENKSASDTTTFS